MRKDHTDLIKLAASTEKTPELENFWAEKYQEILKNELFILSPKTEELAKSNQVIDKPATPLGEISLVNHLTEENDLDEEALQETALSSIRLLDSLIDKINFDEEAKNTVSQYRKIGLGISDFKEYLQKKPKSKEAEEIDYIGDLISNLSYRASEFLAEEKGACGNWDKIKKHLRPKEFEHWFNSETEETKDALSLSEETTQEEIKHTQFEIIPRRNSAILVFPPGKEWQFWTDRDNTAPKTEITPTIELETISPDPKKTIDAIEEEEKDSTFDLPKPPEIEEIAVDEESEENEEETPAIITLDEIEEEAEEEIESEFQIGELVEINNPDSQYYGKIYQVYDVLEESNEIKYILEGEEKIEGRKWLEKELLMVDLSEILEKMNSVEEPKIVEVEKEVEKEPEDADELVKIRLCTLIFSQNQNKVITDNGHLPGLIVKNNQNLEKALKKYLSEKLGKNIEIEEEIGSYLSFDKKSKESILHLGYLISTEVEENDLQWKNIGDHFLPKYAKVLLEKYENKRKIVKELKREISILQKMNNEIYSASTNVKKQKTTMSKYALKLERLVKTNTFGDVLVTIQYDSEGPKIVSAESENVQGELKHLMDTFLGLINFVLVNRITPKDLAEQLEKNPNDGMKLKINDLLLVIAAALKEAPSKVEEINSNLLTDIDSNDLGDSKPQAEKLETVTRVQGQPRPQKPQPKAQPAKTAQTAPKKEEGQQKTPKMSQEPTSYKPNNKPLPNISFDETQGDFNMPSAPAAKPQPPKPQPQKVEENGEDEEQPTEEKKKFFNPFKKS